MRPGEWTKNLFVFAGLLFGQRLTDSAAVVRSMAAFTIFCALASVVYLVNDVMDREQDRLHPRKRLRPIASGALQSSTARRMAVVLATGALGAAWWMGVAFGTVATAYVLLLVLYSGPLKHIVIIDVLTIAIGFVLRVVAGAVAVEPGVSWDMVNLIIHRSLLRGVYRCRAVPHRFCAALGKGRSRAFRKELFRNQD